MLIVALTGGIGSGKSTVVEMFQAHGVPVIDTDVIARELLTQDTEQKAQTIAEFGDDIKQTNGDIDRRQLRQRIFSDESARQKLQAILHPAIHQQVLSQIKKLAAPYCIIVIPLLAESRLTYPQHRVLVIDSTRTMQIQRASQRDHCDPALIEKIIESQASPEQRLAIADDVMTNNGDLTDLQREVDKCHELYTRLAAGNSIA